VRPLALVAVAAALALPSAPAAAAPRKLTLPELLRIARQRGPVVPVAEAELEVRRRLKSQALSNWAPTGEAAYGITLAPAIECLGPNGEHNDAARCVSTVDPANGTAVTTTSFNIAGVAMQFEVRVLQPIFTFGKIEHATSAAGHGIEAGRHQLEAARSEMELQAARAYWATKAFRTAFLTLQSGRDEVAPWVDKIEKNLDSPKPTFTLMDLQRLKASLAQVDLLLAEFAKDEKIALAGLRALLGEEVDVDDAELDVTEIVEHPIDYYESAAATHRPELLALDQGVAALRSIARLRISEMLPDLGFVGGVTLRFASSVQDSENAFVNHVNTPSFLFALGIRQPLDIIQKFMIYRRSAAEASVIVAQRGAAQAGVQFEIDQAYADLKEARDRMGIAERGQKVARGWLTAVQQNLDLGTAEPRDLVDAARQYFELRLRYFQAINDVNYATARLRRASGVDVAR
jgi:outer membrane protein